MKEVLESLAYWYHQNKRDLPWRENSDFYRVWLSEVMLQQTQVKTVIPYFQRFLKRFPTLSSLSSSSFEEFLKYWAGLGYYSRAKNFFSSIKLVSEGFKPETVKDLLKLPGIGPYTAGAIASIAFHLPEAILDANVERVLSRLRKIEKIDSKKKRFWKLSQILVTKAYSLGIDPSVFNQALMELGALVCTTNEPNCLNCPLKQICKAYKEGVAAKFPIKKQKQDKLFLKEKVFCIYFPMGKKVLLCFDKSKRWHKGLWDFPKEKPEFLSLKEKYYFEQSYTITNHYIIREVVLFSCDNELKISELGEKEIKLFSLTQKKEWPALPSVCKKGLLKIQKEFAKDLF